MSAEIRARIGAVLDAEVTGLHPLAGGCVGEVYRVGTPAGPDYVAKVGPPGDETLATEGWMLRYLADETALPVPAVVAVGSGVLVMELVPSDGSAGPATEEDAAEHLAALHAHAGPRFGFGRSTPLAGLPQDNTPTSSWIEFYGRRRLVDMARQAHEVGRLPAGDLDRVGALAGRLGRWLEEPPHPALIHGDVWGGNVLLRDGRVAAFIDPAIHFAHPEVELAFVTMFSTFGESFFSRYQEHAPIAPGFFETRRELYLLYPLLVHVRLFGASYLAGVRRILARFEA